MAGMLIRSFSRLNTNLLIPNKILASSIALKYSTHLIKNESGQQDQSSWSPYMLKSNAFGTKTNNESSINKADDSVDREVEFMRKRPTASFALFFKDKYAGEKMLSNSKSNSEIMKQLAEKWKTMSYSDKANYFTTADKFRKELQAEKSKLLETKTKEEISMLKQLVKKAEATVRKESLRRRRKKISLLENRPKKPAPPFFLYIKTLDRGDASLSDFIKGAARKWNALPIDDKKRFEETYQDNYAVYKESLKDWEAKMICEGKQDLARKKQLLPILKKLETAVNKREKKSVPKKKVAAKSRKSKQENEK